MPKKLEEIRRAVARRGSAKNPWAVATAVYKKMRGKKDARKTIAGRG